MAAKKVSYAEDCRQALLRGPRIESSNVYLIDGAGILVGAQRPLDQTRRDLRGGEAWRSPETRPPGEGEDRFAETPEEQLLAAIEERYAAMEASTREDLRGQRIAQTLKKHRGRLERKLRNLESDAEAAAAAPELVEMDARLIVLGTGNEQLVAGLVELAGRHPDRIAVLERFDRDEARRIYAGADLFLMPSRFEPCGQGQLIKAIPGLSQVNVITSRGQRCETIDSYRTTRILANITAPIGRQSQVGIEHRCTRELYAAIVVNNHRSVGCQ